MSLPAAHCNTSTPYPQIVGWGKYIPTRVLTNLDLERTLDTSDAWIRSRTGIRERRLAGPGDTASTMAIQAGQQALERAQVAPQELDMVVVATSTPERVFPPCACLVQHALGATNAAAFDLNAACTGFVYALATACQFILAGTYRTILVVGSDIISRLVDWSDRATCVLFGDGAGAVVLRRTTGMRGSLSYVLGSDGSGADLLYVPGLCGGLGGDGQDKHHLKMNGPEVFRFAVNAIIDVTRQAVAATGLTMVDIDLFIPHQANERIIRAAAKGLRLPKAKVFMNVDRYGNTSAASIPIALCEAAEAGRLQPGHRLVLVGFGSGLTWGAMVLEWGKGEVTRT